MTAPTDIASTLPAWAGTERVVRSHWTLRARTERDAGSLLLALWGSDERDREGGPSMRLGTGPSMRLGTGFLVRAAFLRGERVQILELPVAADAALFPSLAEIFPSAARMERTMHDLLGLRAENGDPRPWLRHAAWPDDLFPLRRDADATRTAEPRAESYPFVRVQGDGVHEIPVGPVHAGIIEPGHFRFSIVGEKVLRLEQRLGYVHKGIEKRFESLAAREGHRLAARVSGDSAVAFSWAYCMALEQVAGLAVPPRALQLRALALERERLANHLGDLGALGNDAGFAFGLAQFSRLKEDLLRVNAASLGARYLMDYVVPGGVAHDLPADAASAIFAQSDALETELRALRAIYDEHAGVQDRFMRCGIVTPALAGQLGLVGLAARASGQARDLRCELPEPPYAGLAVAKAVRSEGDVAARVAVRFDEAFESLRLCRAVVHTLAEGPVRTEPPAQVAAGLGLGLVEGWRGPVLVALETDAEGGIRRCHPHDPSWQNWPLLEHAIIGDIVPDFPLINKSFNLSYSGQDL